MRVQRAAAALRPRHVHVAAVRREHARGGAVHVAEDHALHAAGEQRDARAPSPPGGRSGGQRGADHGGATRLQRRRAGPAPAAGAAPAPRAARRRCGSTANSSRAQQPLGPRPRARARSTSPRVSSIRRSYCTPDGHAVTHAMQPRQRSKCSATWSVSSIEPSASAPISRMRPRGESISSCHSVVGRARRQAEAAVHAVGDQLGRPHRLHRRARRSAAPALRPAILGRVGDGRARPHQRRRPRQSQRRRPRQRRLQLADLRPSGRASSPPSSRSCAATERSRALERARAARRRRGRRRSARAASVQRRPARRRHDDGARRRRQRVQPQRERARRCRAARASRRTACRGRSRRRSSRPCRRSSRACRRASTTVTPSTRSRIVPKRWRSGPERSSSRHCAERRRSPGGSSDSRWPCAASVACSCASAQSAPDDARSGRRARTRSRRRALTALREAGALERVHAVGARAPRRTGAASGTPCRDWRARPGRSARRSRAIASRSASLNSSGIAQALSVPMPCSPVSEPPASMQASRIALGELVRRARPRPATRPS